MVLYNLFCAAYSRRHLYNDKTVCSALFFCRVIGAVSLFYGVSKILGYFSHDLYNLAFQFDLALGVFTLIFGFDTSAALCEGRRLYAGNTRRVCFGGRRVQAANSG